MWNFVPLTLLQALILVGCDGTDSSLRNVPQWGRTVIALPNATFSGNPFELEIDATFTHAGTGTTLTLPGYYDGNHTWKIGFMPTEVGRWTYLTSSGDTDLDGITGRVDAVASGHPGLLAADAAHPNKWKYADGKHVVPIGVFVSAMLDEATARQWAAMADFLRDHHLQLLNFRICEHDLAFAAVGALQMNLPLWQRLERRMDLLADRGLGVDVMLYTDDAGRPSFGPQSAAERLLIRYMVARLASYPVVMFNSGIDVAEYRDRNWVNWYGRHVRDLDPYGHPVSSRYTGGSGNLAMKGQTYNSVGDRNSAIEALIDAYDARDDIPAANNDNWSEDLAGNINGHTRADIRRAGWKATVAGGVGFHVRHDTLNCFGALTECDRYFDAAALPDQFDAGPWLRRVNPFVNERLGETFAAMEPAPALVDASGGKYALADPARTRILYLLMGRNDTWDSGDGGSVTVKLAGEIGTYDATWFDPRTGTETHAGTLAAGSDRTLDPPNSDDWLLLLEQTGVTPPNTP